MTPRVRLGVAVGLAVVIVGAAWGARASEGRRALAACDAAFARGDRVEAIVAARAASEARCPGCAAPELGFARLYAIAKDAETRGDDTVAVGAWRAVRAATLGAAVLDTAPARRQRADAEIARLEHRIDVAGAAAGGVSAPAATEERLRAALASNDIPSGSVFVLLTIGGALFLAGAVRFSRATTFRVFELALAALGAGIAAVALLF